MTEIKQSLPTKPLIYTRGQMCPCESPGELSVPRWELSQPIHIFPNLDRRFSCLSLASARDNLCKNDMTFISLSNYRADSLISLFLGHGTFMETPHWIALMALMFLVFLEWCYKVVSHENHHLICYLIHLSLHTPMSDVFTNTGLWNALYLLRIGNILDFLGNEELWN